MSSMPAASPPPASGDGRVPRTPPERIGLLFLLVILPVALVMLPAILVTAIFGQRPRPAAAMHEPAADNTGLRSALERTAQQAMPDPSAIAEEPIVLTVRPERLAARIQKIGGLAKSLGGSMTQGLPRPDGADLYIDLPAGGAGAFRAALASPNASPPPAADAGSGNVHLEVTLRVARDDE